MVAPLREGALCEEPHYEWVPIDALVEEAVAGLGTGEMIHTFDFSLADTMTAVEIMDPKMDGGFGVLAAPHLEEMVDAQQVLRTPTDTQAVAILDRLLAAECTWLSGHALAQTVYTCIYVHQPPLIEHAAVAVYLKALLKCCLLTCHAVAQSEIREDEDFVPLLFGLDLGLETAPEAIVEELEGILQELLSAGKQPEADATAINALARRLEYRKHYLQFLTRATAEDYSAIHHVPDLLPLLDHCRHCLKLMASDRAPEALGPELPLPEGAFSNHCIRWVDSPTPLLPVPILTWTQAHAAADQYMEDLQRAMGVAQCLSLPQLLHFLHAYSERRASMAARVCLWSMVYNPKDYRILNRDALQRFVLHCLEVDYGAPFYRSLTHDPLPEPAEDALLTPQHYLQETIFRWTDKASACIWLLMNALCSNRARVRRKVANLFGDLGAWQQQSREADFAVIGTEGEGAGHEVLDRCLVLTAYANDVTLSAMALYLHLGCELELFKPSELQAVYWYLDYALSMRLQNYGLLHRAPEAPPAAPPTRPTRGKARRRPPDAPPALPAAITTRTKPRPTTPTHILLEAHCYLTRALSRFIAALSHAGFALEPPSKLSLSDPALVFTNRVKPFLFLIHPPYARYEAYLAYTNTTNHNAGDLRDAVELLQRCKAVLEGTVAVIQGEQYTAPMHSLLKVVKANLVAMQLYQQGHAAGKEAAVDWSASPHYPVIKFRRKAEKPPEPLPTAP